MHKIKQRLFLHSLEVSCCRKNLPLSGKQIHIWHFLTKHLKGRGDLHSQISILWYIRNWKSIVFQRPVQWPSSWKFDINERAARSLGRKEVAILREFSYWLFALAFNSKESLTASSIVREPQWIKANTTFLPEFSCLKHYLLRRTQFSWNSYSSTLELFIISQVFSWLSQVFVIETYES